MEIKNEMYGSVHTHFEDWFDTANDTKSMIKNFASRGCKKIAITGHGSMFAYEDAKEALDALKAKPDDDHPDRDPIPDDIEIVPGVEVYFGDEARHMILIAKDYEGYQCLCKVITESSKNSKSSKNTSEDSEYLTPIVTMDNLRKNIVKGKVFATSACVGGLFCHDLGLISYKLKENIAKKEEKTKKFSYNEKGEYIITTAKERYDKAKAFVDDFDAKKTDPLNKMPTKAEITKINKIATKLSGEGKENEAKEALDILDERIRRAESFKLWKQNNTADYNVANKELAQAEKELAQIEEAVNEYKAYEDTANNRFEKAKAEYKEFEEIFGKENFFFEIQNHGLEMEQNTYNAVVKLAYEVGNPNFVASNDVHVGDIKGSATFENSLKKRKFERFNRFKTIEDERGDETEYGIKSDSELRDMLLKNIVSCKDASGVEHSSKEIVDKAIGNIEKILSKCNVKFPEISIDGINHYPKFCDDEKAMFREEVEKGAKERFPNGLPEGYRERLDYEMGIIESMGYSGYHLIVKDYLEYGRLLGYLTNEEDINNAPLSVEELKQYIEDKNVKKIGMSIGPGRGSAAGSLVCYCLKITDLDPIPLGLLFERFLNPSRQTMPDIDSDFKNDIRDHVYEYIKKRYGDEYVSKVCTKSYAFGKKALMIARSYMSKEAQANIEKDANYKYLPKQDPKRKEASLKVTESNKHFLKVYDKISKLVDTVIDKEGLSKVKTEDGTKALKIIIDQHLYETDEERDMINHAIDISGIPGALSMHACACLISGDPLGEVIPLAWNETNKKMTTECLYPQAENLGLLKMDLLGLKNLTVITKVMQKTGDDKLLHPDTLAEILANKDIYEKIYARGYTQGVFQVESKGMTEMIKDFKPTCFEDIILLVAAYRPGPLSFIPEIISTKRYLEDPEHNKKPTKSIEIDNPKLNAILAPTYGVPIYQEQVMQIFQSIAGYDLAGADNVRRFMSKKKTDKLEAEKPKFVKGCEENGISKEQAEKFFDQLVDFSKYAFNKSHAACYALVSVMTAYLKRMHPREFYQESMSLEMSDSKNSDIIAKYMPEFDRLGVDKLGTPYLKLLPPEIGKSSADITIEGRNLRLGYGNIKGESYTDYVPAGSIEAFILKNPTISDATLKKFVSLGMLDAAWDCHSEDEFFKETKRVNGNIDYLAKFIDKNFQTIKNLASIKSEIKDCELLHKNSLDDVVCCEQTILYKQEEGASEEELSSLRQDHEELIKLDEELLAKIEALYAEKDSIENILKEEKERDYNSNVFISEPDVTMKENLLKNQEDLLGYCFSISEQVKDLKNKKGSSFDDIDKAVAEKEDIKLDFYVPAIIATQDKKSSKNGKPYYRLRLFDKNGSSREITSFHEPKIREGKMKITYNPASNGFRASFILNSEEPFELSKENSKAKEEDGIERS